MITINLPSGTSIIVNTPEEAARVVEALNKPTPSMHGNSSVPHIAAPVPSTPRCTCYDYGTWMSVLPPPPCPVHGGGHCKVTCEA